MKEIDKRRQRKIDKAEGEKKLIRMWNKQLKLWEAGRKNVELVELPKPIKRGYARFFVLRPDIAKSKDADMYRGLLKFVNTTVTCRRKDFLYKPWNSKVYKPIEQGISFLRHDEWLKAEKVLTLRQKSMFDKRWHQLYHKGKPAGGFWGWHLQKDWMFVLKIEPYYQTHAVVVNPELESETKRLWDMICFEGRYYKIAKILGWRVNRDRSAEWENRRLKLIQKAIGKTEKQYLSEIEEWFDPEDDCGISYHHHEYKINI